MSVSRPRLEAADRVTLLMSFVPYLLDQGPVSVDQIAEHFDISTTEVSGLVQLLALSGLPGGDGLYQHQDLFDINWDLFEEEQIVELWNHVAVDATPKFSSREAAALVAGLQYISGIIPDSDKSVLQALLAKIAEGASAHPENILISAAPVPVDLEIIRDAVRTDKSITFSYLNSRSERLDRAVDPIRLDLVGQTWYLRGWCHARSALRTFRLDRMNNLALSGEPRVSTLTDADLPAELFDVSATDIEVIFLVNKKALPFLSPYKPRVVASVSDDEVTVAVGFADMGAVPRFVMQLPGAITVQSPPEARELVISWAKRSQRTDTP
ncbi:proteasome accessory factor C [Aurantimicrobium minutum]|uniref:helix-turn-helix transcriptional regulator n=1 Tax=Aurantimicrobium minutum TaxID=708131 RepID=UPI0024770A7D|nr:WYL domain-containing protein [Aurantimicrobium minutum]MDH6532920.1 proteasome accessory factor C [Aurantimicrobium minutum]